MARPYPGFFLTLEGGDHSGKSSQIDNIRRYLEQHGFQTVITREPGGTPLGRKLRHLVLHDPAAADIAPMTEMLLMAVDRSEHVDKVIRPALAAGKIVVSDRFADSTIAYQGYGLGLNPEDIYLINRVVTGDLKPDLTILFDVPVAEFRARSRRTPDRTPDRIESRNDEFFVRVRWGFLELARREPERFAIIDATQPPQEVTRQLLKTIQHRVISQLSGGLT